MNNHQKKELFNIWQHWNFTFMFFPIQICTYYTRTKIEWTFYTGYFLSHRFDVSRSSSTQMLNKDGWYLVHTIIYGITSFLDATWRGYISRLSKIDLKKKKMKISENWRFEGRVRSTYLRSQEGRWSTYLLYFLFVLFLVALTQRYVFFCSTHLL